MSKTVVFEGAEHEFPDDFSDAEISTALASAHPQERPRPAAAVAPTDDWRGHLLAMLPAIGMTTGGVLGGLAGLPEGGIGAVPGAVIGGGVGGASGRILEQFGRQMMGRPPNQSMTGGIASALGHQLPPWLNSVTDTGEQGLMGGVMEGVPTWAMGFPGKIPGAMESVLTQFAKGAESKAAARAVEKTRAVAGARAMTPEETQAVQGGRVANAVGRSRNLAQARDIAPDIASAEMAARAMRQQAGAEIPKTLKAASGPEQVVTVNDMVNHIIDAQNARFGSSENKGALVPQVKKLLSDVIEEHTAGAIKGNRVAYPLDLANIARQALDGELAGGFKSAERGVYRNPSLVSLTRAALHDLIEQKAPEMAEVNRAASQAIREHQDVRRLASEGRGPTVRGLKQLRSERVAAAGATPPQNPALASVRLSQRERAAAEMARQDFSRPFMEPHITLHGISMPAPTLGRLALGASRLVGHPAASGLGRFSPDMLNLLFRYMQPQSQFPPGGAPPDQTQAPPAQGGRQ